MKNRKKQKKKFLDSKFIKLLYNKYIVAIYTYLLLVSSWLIWSFHFYFYAPESMRPKPGERTFIITWSSILKILQQFELYRRENGVFVGMAYIIRGIAHSWFLYSYCLLILFVFYDHICVRNKKANSLLSGISIIIIGMIAAIQFNSSAGFRDFPFFPLVWGILICIYACFVVISVHDSFSKKLHAKIPLTRGRYLIDILWSLPMTIFILGWATLSAFLTGAPAGSYVCFILSSAIGVFACAVCWLLVRNTRMIDE